VKDISGGISWDRQNDVQPVVVHIILEGLPRRDARELTDAFNKLGSYRKVLLKLFPLGSQDATMVVTGFINAIDSGGGAKPVTLKVEESE
jgi:hypothetical protein